MSGQDNFELAKNHNATPGKIDHYLRHLRTNDGLPSRNDLNVLKKSGETLPTIELSEVDLTEKIVGFLSRSRTGQEIVDTFGNEVFDRILSTKIAGYNLFTNINEYSENIYILLPELRREINLLPRNWSFQHSIEPGQKTKQPYQLVNLPDSIFDNEDQSIKLLPLFDIHLGHHSHKAEKFRSYLRYIKETPNVLTWLGGDICENALDDGRGMTYEQEFGPSTQIDWATYLLSEVSHKILFAQPGNHEWRTYNRAGIDPTKVIADRLDVPYFDGPVFCSIVCGGRKWNIYSQHGTGNSQTKGGKMNSAGRPRRFVDNLHFLVSGHVHDPVVNSETVIREDPANCRLIYPQVWTVIAPSFLGWSDTYAYRAGYAPPGAGGVSLHLYKNGDYSARLSEK